MVTDPGRALITGKWKDVGNGAAATLADVVSFYDTRFGLGLTEPQKADLVAFLRTL